MGSGIHPTSNPNILPITQTIREWERRVQNQGIGGGKVETAAVFDANGNPIGAYIGNRHSVGFRPTDLDLEGVTFTHFHPDKNFGGTLSMQDLKMFAQSKWKEMRAYTAQGQLYSVRANNDVNREGLSKWIKSHEKILRKNFANSYMSALKNATTVIQSGAHAGKVKLNQPNGKPKYVEPLTKAQAAAYARTYSVGMFERTYKKNLSKFGITFTKTKGGQS